RSGVVMAAPAAALARVPDEFEARLAAAWQWLTSGTGEVRDVVVLGDPRYPAALLDSADPPLLLYARGRIELLAAPAIAIVGNRNATAQGLENARAFASHLSGEGWVVVSGLALGIDGAAHEGGLAGGAGTIAVVGTGLDRVYPARHRALAQKIAAGGLLVSEFAIGTPALAENFPIRNRIIAGLTRGTLVVEAAVQSGSLITARLAAEAGRDVFAIPGSIHSPQSRGCHALIKQGAKLVDSAADIVDELTPIARARRVPSAVPAAGATAASRDPLLEALGFDPIGLDALIARTGQSAAELSARLLDFELQGRVARLPGQRFQRVERG
ncbi:MAG: DNA-processing protein DprA, partial [Pseudomonadota bacterium]|nr:DNA-processing protein DprA [Pseudomonadota bacterium]